MPLRTPPAWRSRPRGSGWAEHRARGHGVQRARDDVRDEREVRAHAVGHHRRRDDLETFRIDRKPNDHLAFGIGAHFCLGSNLARVEIRIVFRELLRRLPDIRVAPGEGPVRVPSPLVAAIASLPLVFTPEGGVPERPAAR